eukprot:7403529-Heterocapsa_arctica.AAC.1
MSARMAGSLSVRMRSSDSSPAPRIQLTTSSATPTSPAPLRRTALASAKPVRRVAPMRMGALFRNE